MWLLYLLVVVAVACFMEGVAWFLHKYVMHGFLWVLHEDHHRPTKARFEKNDLFGVFFAILSIALFAIGAWQDSSWVISVAVGITAYGVGYLLFHDIMFHKRIKAIRIRSKHPYMRRITRAHADHHQHSRAHEGVSFSFLYAPSRYNVA